jgi:hypothetical protein
MTLTLFFFLLSNGTTHALLGQSLSHKTVTVGEPTQSSDVVTEWLPYGMVVRMKEKKEKDGCNHREKKEEKKCSKRCSNAPTNGQVLHWTTREHQGKNARKSDQKSQPVIGCQQVMGDVKEKREEERKVPLGAGSKVVKIK